MAKETLANVPYFFKGTYEQLTTALSPGGRFYPLDKIAYGYVTDKNCMFYCDIEGHMSFIGDNSHTVVPEVGTVGKPIVLSELTDGIYSVSGSYKFSETDPVISSSSPHMFLVDRDSIMEITSSGITKNIVTVEGTIVTEEYITDGDITRCLASDEDIKDIFS